MNEEPYIWEVPKDAPFRKALATANSLMAIWGMKPKEIHDGNVIKVLCFGETEDDVEL